MRRLASSTIVILFWCFLSVTGAGQRTGVMEEDLSIIRPLGGQTDDTLQAFINMIGGTTKTLLLTPGTWLIHNDLTIPANITLWAPPNAFVAIDPGRTLTINGPHRFPMDQVFTGTGQVVWGPFAEVYPEWWGAKGDHSTDGLLAFRRALSSLAASGGGTLRVSEGGYLLVPDATFYVGSLGTGTVIECAQGRTSILKLGGPVHLDGQARAFFQVINAHDTVIRNCVFDYNGHQWATGAPLQLYWAIHVEGTSRHTVIENNEFRNNPGTQSVVVGGSGFDHLIRGNRFVNGCRDIPGGNPNCTDFTALYVQSLGARVEENVFEWENALGDPSWARSGVEIHTSASGISFGAKVLNNHFYNVSLAIRLECDNIGHQLVDAEVAHNVISLAQIGIFLSSAPGMSSGQCDIRKANIHNNHVEIKETSLIPPLTTGIIGIGSSPFGGSNRPVVFAAKVHHNTIELAQAHKAYTDNELGIWFSSIYDSEISDNILVNGTVFRLSSGLFGVRGVQVRRNSFTNVVNDFASDHALMWLDFTGASVSTQNLWVDGNVFTRNPDSAPLVNTFAFQVDGDPGHNIFFTNNLIRNIDPQVIGTLGSMNVFSNTRAFYGALDVVKGVTAVQDGLAIYTDAAPSSLPAALLKIERGSDGTRDIIGVGVNGIGVFRVSPTGCLHIGGGTQICSYSRSGAALDFPEIPAGGTVEMSIPVTNALAGDIGDCSPAGVIEDGLIWSCRVIAGNVVVRLGNISGAPIDPVLAEWGGSSIANASVLP